MWWSFFLINLQAFRQAWKFIKKIFQHGCFSVKFTKFLRAPILKNICKRLLLNQEWHEHPTPLVQWNWWWKHLPCSGVKREAKVIYEVVFTWSILTKTFFDIFPTDIYLLKVNNRNPRTGFKICSELTIKTLNNIKTYIS